MYHFVFENTYYDENGQEVEEPGKEVTKYEILCIACEKYMKINIHNGMSKKMDRRITMLKDELKRKETAPAYGMDMKKFYEEAYQEAFRYHQDNELRAFIAS